MAEDLALRHGDYRNEGEKALVDLMTHLLIKDRDLLIKLLDTGRASNCCARSLPAGISPTRLA
jgi:hypothetical protein